MFYYIPFFDEALFLHFCRNPKKYGRFHKCVSGDDKFELGEVYRLNKVTNVYHNKYYDPISNPSDKVRLVPILFDELIVLLSSEVVEALEPGEVVELRNGETGIIIDTLFGNAIFTENNLYLTSEYSMDFKHNSSSHLDVINIKNTQSIEDYQFVNHVNLEKLWERRDIVYEDL